MSGAPELHKVEFSFVVVIHILVPFLIDAN